MYFTERQLKILTFIRGFILGRQVSPTLEEIARHFEISPVTAHEHIRALEKKGALRKVKNRARSIELADDPRDPRSPSYQGHRWRSDDPHAGDRQGQPGPRAELPILGTIAAGLPIEAIEAPETLSLEQWFPQGANHFVLQVRGDSMVEDGICDGDLVIVERRATARDGEVVVALVDHREATLKRLYREGDRIRLQPASAALDAIYPEHVEVQGVLVGLLRRYDR